MVFFDSQIHDAELCGRSIVLYALPHWQQFYQGTGMMKSANRKSWIRPRWMMVVGMLPFAINIASAQQSKSLPPGVVAVQGGVQVTLQDIDVFAQKIPEKDRAGFFDSPIRIQNMIMGMLLTGQLASEARKQRLDSDPQIALRVKHAVDDSLAEAELDHFRKALKFPEFEGLAQEYYTTHKDEFFVHGAVDVKHVLVSKKGRTDAEAQSRIAEVAAAALKHPEQFDALVEKYSDDPSKTDNHGLIQDAAGGKTVAQFAQAASALKTPGEISPSIKTQFGYHVLMLVERKPDSQKTYAEAHEGLIAKLRQDYIDKQAKDHTDQLRNNPLDASPELVASLRTRFLPPGAVMPQEAGEAAREAAKKAAEKDANPAH
jgi:parvulin-like peptidyl-prolyl isomerase